jgi:hypothetical protein
MRLMTGKRAGTLLELMSDRPKDPLPGMDWPRPFCKLASRAG